MSEDNKALIRRYFEEIWNKHNLDAIEDFYAPEYVNHDAPPGVPGDIEGLKALIGAYLNAFPDIKVTTNLLLADGDKVVVRNTATGTHSGQLMEIPATGKQIETKAMGIFGISGGKIVESWVASDRMSMMQQLGVIPAPEEA